VALRALVVVRRAGPSGSAPVAPDPCTGCEAPCLQALDHARREGERLGGQVEDHWRDWLAVRDACPEGRASRYPDDQIAYHYGKERRWLEGD
jgi:methylmalonic aciduria homocystinuria type C protein